MFRKYRNAVLVTVFCLSLAIIVYVVFFHRGEGARDSMVLFVSSSEAREKINEHQDAFILDVRSAEEFFSVRIPGSVNIPYLMIRQEQDLLPSDRHHLIFIYCRTGRRAAIAAHELVALGFTDIIVFPGMATWVYETVTG